MVDYLLQNFEILSLISSMIIFFMTFLSNKKIEKIKIELQESLNKKTIEFEKIQEKKVEGISKFIDNFTIYLATSSMKKGKELESVIKDYDAKKEFMLLANTLMLYCDDYVIHSYEKFREKTVDLILEREEIVMFCKNYDINKRNKIIKEEIHIPAELNSKLSRMTEINKMMRDEYSEFVLSLRTNIGISTKLSNTKYMEIIMSK